MDISQQNLKQNDADEFISHFWSLLGSCTHYFEIVSKAVFQSVLIFETIEERIID